MKKTSAIILMTLLTMAAIHLDARNSIGGYNVYYGHLHNHSDVSDGKYSPDYAYNYAKYTGHLDFFSLSDHSTMISDAEWAATKNAADKYNEPGVFTAFHGFEWTNNHEGHITVINTDDYVSTASSTSTFPGLCNWLNSRNCVAFFNHPGHTDETGIEFRHFNSRPCNKVIGMELWNQYQRFERFYYKGGYDPTDGNLTWYDEALTRGWMIGAAGSEDNHWGTWGTMTESKLAVLANANTREDILDALKARRFYSTYDKTLALSFKIAGNEMGSVVPGGTHELQIMASDAENEIFTTIELLRNGYVVATWAPESINPIIHYSLNCYDREYYYIRVKQADGDEAISSPIWIAGGDFGFGPANKSLHPSKSGSQSFTFDLTTDLDGWSGDFADYPAVDSQFYGLEFKRTKLPQPLDTGKYAYKISGNNHSDDLFMFLKRKFTGLAPNKTYQLGIDIELASDAPTNAIGIGGAPGESVYLKAGATLIEPRKVSKDGFYLMNIDKSNQSSPGADMDTIGNIGVSDTTTVFTLIRRTNAGHRFNISTDDTGTVWICIGSDSGFEGTTTLYYNKITVSFDIAIGTHDVADLGETVLYPNPARDVLFIDSSNRTAISSVEIFTLDGRAVTAIRSSNSISLKGLKPGTYYVRVSYTDSSRYAKMIIVQ